MRWRVIIFLLTAVVARSAGPPGDEPAARPVDPAKFDAALLAKEIFRASNRVREENGAHGLRPQIHLDEAADDQAYMMATLLHCGHDNPLPGRKNALQRVERRGLQPEAVAENVIFLPACDAESGRLFTYREVAQEIVTRWMNSPVHRVNLLQGNFTHLGCAARLATGPGDQPLVFAVQVFGLLP